MTWPRLMSFSSWLTTIYAMSWRRAAAWWGPAVVFAACRVPSFFEPHWYTDEAGYASTARALLRGFTLYTGAWTNKPPLHILMVALPISLFGPSEAGLHALTFACGLLAVMAVAFIARRLLSSMRALVATLVFAVVIGLPLFDAQLVVPESLLIAPTTWASAIVLAQIFDSSGRRSRWLSWGWAALAGALMGVALGIQQTVLADAAAFAIVIGLSHRGGRRALFSYLLALLVVVTTWLVPVLAQAGAGPVAFALVGFYQGYVAASLPSTSGLTLRLAGAALGLVGVLLARGMGYRLWPLWLWACADLTVAAIANRPYPHFLIPALAPVILALASVRVPWRRLLRVPWRVLRWRMIPLTAAVALTGYFAMVSGIELKPVVAYATWPAAQVGHTRDQWAAQLDQRSVADELTAKWIVDQRLSQSTAVVWSSDAWVYLLAGLNLNLPAAPIYNDVVLLGSGQAVASQVAALQPYLIVTSEDALQQWPDIKPLLADHYNLATTFYPDKVYVRSSLSH
jgi:4-amino-4-deoxy-L-arabinose transferase-like glycosyltransferase